MRQTISQLHLLKTVVKFVFGLKPGVPSNLDPDQDQQTARPDQS